MLLPSRSQSGKTALIEAVEKKHFEAVDMLLRRGNVKNGYGMGQQINHQGPQFCYSLLIYQQDFVGYSLLAHVSAATKYTFPRSPPLLQSREECWCQCSCS